MGGFPLLEFFKVGTLKEILWRKKRARKKSFFGLDAGTKTNKIQNES